MSKEKINKDDVLIAIYKKFKSLDDCARALGISTGNLSNKLRRLTSKFIAQLESIGVYIERRQLSMEELQLSIEKTNKEIEKLKAKIFDLQSEIEEIKKGGQIN